jgi:hypothetical protein
MTVVAIKDIEDCLDGSLIRELLLGGPITSALIHHLGQMGTLQYFPHFPRPFFRVDGEGVMFKGIEGNESIRVTLFNKNKLDGLEALIRAFSPSAGE